MVSPRLSKKASMENLQLTLYLMVKYFCFVPNIEDKVRMTTHTPLIAYSARRPNQQNRARQENKVIRTGKGEI